MNTEDFAYDLPPELIAQSPLDERDRCRLLHLDKRSGLSSHHLFRDVLSFLKSGDRLVLNDTKVLPARVFARKRTGAKIELLFTERIDSSTWKTLMKPARRAMPNTLLSVDEFENAVRVDRVLENGDRMVSATSPEVSIDMLLETKGVIPLPHYITREAEPKDRIDYQTVYAKEPGAVAAPTAGLHFTEALLELIKKQGIGLTYVTLHTGVGTFRPVKAKDPRQHEIHEEAFSLSQKAVDEILQTKRNGGRIIAVGTTVIRVLEHCASITGSLESSHGRTRLFILPPYQFRIVDGLITNFHLPRSTLLMLVCAFASTESVLNSYRQAVENRYRFFSYGDAMLLI